MKINLHVNGEPTNIDVEAEMPLLWVLRDVLNLTGTKYGCGKGLCGACTVHVNGVATRSCITPVSLIKNGKVTTIEGLGANNTQSLNIVQKAWVDADVPQCGFCQAGQIMQAASYLNQNANPTTEQFEQSLAGNICRCGTYIRIKKAIRNIVESKQKKHHEAQKIS